MIKMIKQTIFRVLLLQFGFALSLLNAHADFTKTIEAYPYVSSYTDIVGRIQYDFHYGGETVMANFTEGENFTIDVIFPTNKIMVFDPGPYSNVYFRLALAFDSGPPGTFTMYPPLIPNPQLSFHDLHGQGIEIDETILSGSTDGIDFFMDFTDSNLVSQFSFSGFSISGYAMKGDVGLTNYQVRGFLTTVSTTNTFGDQKFIRFVDTASLPPPEIAIKSIDETNLTMHVENVLSKSELSIEQCQNLNSDTWTNIYTSVQTNVYGDIYIPNLRTNTHSFYRAIIRHIK